VAAPEEPSDQGFDGIGWASRIFTRYFATRTVDGDQVIQLNGAPVPEWFARSPPGISNAANFRFGSSTSNPQPRR
jgi:hypothetical protein